MKVTIFGGGGGKKLLKLKMCFVIFFTNLSERFLILRIIKQGIILNYIAFHVKYPIFFSDFNETWIFWTDFRNIPKHKTSSKFVQWKLSFLCGRKDILEGENNRF
jgi:hypothetical protein